MILAIVGSRDHMHRSKLLLRASFIVAVTLTALDLRPLLAQTNFIKAKPSAFIVGYQPAIITISWCGSMLAFSASTFPATPTSSCKICPAQAA
jgi:hypothetical protein